MSDILHQLRQVVDDRLRRVNTCLPGRVDSYDAQTRTAEVTPLVQERYADGTLLPPPSIAGVPIVMPGGASSGLCIPIAAGDIVLLLFAQRSIDGWKSDGGSVDPQDARMHSLADAVGIAGLFPSTTSHVDGDGLLLYNGQAKLRLHNGTVALGTAVVELLDQLTTALDAVGNSNCVNGAPLTLAAQILAASAQIKTIMGSI